MNRLNAHAVGGGQGGAHPQEAAVGRALLGERLVDLLEIAIDPVEQFAAPRDG